MRRFGVVMVGLAATMLAGGAEAQRVGDRDVDRPAGYFSFSLLAADPVGELGGFFDQGFGAQFGGGIPIAAEGRLRLRAELGFLNYGIERQSYCFSLPIGCRVDLDLTTTNNIFFGGVGPEVVLATGRFEPYLASTVGFSWFATTSSIDGNGHDDGFGSTTHLSDGVVRWTAGGGVRVQVTNGYKPVALDFGIERHHNGQAEFLTKGDIQDHPDGSITIFPNRSEANLTTFRFGVSIGLPHSGRNRGN